MGPLEPPRVVTTTGVTYRPRHTALPIPLVVLFPLLTVPFGPEPLLLGLVTALAVLPLLGWSSEATIRAHELVVARSWMGFVLHERSFPWEVLRGAEVSPGGRLELTTVSGVRCTTPVRGSLGQVAWIAGEINVRALRAAAAEASGATDAARYQLGALRRAAFDRRAVRAG